MGTWNEMKEGFGVFGWVLGYWENADLFAVCCGDAAGKWSAVLPGKVIPVEPPSHWTHLPSAPTGEMEEDDDKACSFCLTRGCNGECI